MATVWTLEEGQRFCSWLEKNLEPLGIHVALGGSVLVKGGSSKDIDVFLYPHDARKPPTAGRVFDMLLLLGFTYTRTRENSTPSCPEGDKDVYVMFTKKGKRRVDFFFLFSIIRSPVAGLDKDVPF